MRWKYEVIRFNWLMHRSSWAKYIETVKIKAKGCESSYDFRFRSSFSGSSVTQTGRKSKFFARLCHLFSMISATLSQLASNRIFPRWHLVNFFDNRLTKSVWRSENLGQIFCSYKTLPSIACNNRLVFFQAWSTWLQMRSRMVSRVRSERGRTVDQDQHDQRQSTV